MRTTNSHGAATNAAHNVQQARRSLSTTRRLALLHGGAVAVALHDPAHGQRRRLAGTQRAAGHNGRELPHHLLLHLPPSAPERVSGRSRRRRRRWSRRGSFLRSLLRRRWRRRFSLGRSRSGSGSGSGRGRRDGCGRGHELRGLRRGVGPERGLEVLDHGHDEWAHGAGHDLGGEVEDVVGHAGAGADEELRHLVAEVVAVVGEEAVRLGSVPGRDVTEVVLEHLARDVRDAQLHRPQRPPVRRRPGGRRLDPAAEVVLVPVHHHARVPARSDLVLVRRRPARGGSAQIRGGAEAYSPDGLDGLAEEGGGQLPREAVAEVVHVQRHLVPLLPCGTTAINERSVRSIYTSSSINPCIGRAIESVGALTSAISRFSVQMGLEFDGGREFAGRKRKTRRENASESEWSIHAATPKRVDLGEDERGLGLAR